MRFLSLKHSNGFPERLTEIIPKVLILCNCSEDTAGPCPPQFVFVYFNRGKYKLTTLLFSYVVRGCGVTTDTESHRDF